MSDAHDKTPINRRDFMTSATGYALAVSPITALAITTPATDLQVQEVAIKVGQESMPAYVARPKKAGAAPCILVLHEIFGLHEYIRDVCRRLAQLGYVAISPYLYFRQGDATKIADIDTLRKQIIDKVAQKQVLADLDATVDWLATQQDAKVSALGITGFCWGGTVTWMYAAHQPKVKAGVAWYGRLTGEKTPLVPRYPLDIAAELKKPVLGLYGGKDKGIPLDQVEAMKGKLAKGPSGSRIIVYPEAEHGFHADYRPSYNEQAAKNGWNELQGWFKKHL